MRILLAPAGWLFRAAVGARTALYSRGILRTRRLERPVISVGNLSVGGTGKTPFVIWLFQQLSQRGFSPAVLTRGYRRKDRRRTILLPDQNEAAERAGDEVQVMLRHGVAPIAVDADRFRAAQALTVPQGGAEGLCQVFLLDDGFQHLQLARDLDIVLLDSSRPPWKDALLPAGRLREPPAALRRAGVIVLTRVQNWTPVDEFKRRIRRWNPGAEIYTARTRLIDRAPSGALLAFCGTGNPKAFIADLCVAGAKVIAKRFFPDHYRYARADLEAIERQARDAGAEALVTTEKDDVNLPAELRARLAFPLRAIRMEMDVEGGEALVDRILEVQSLKSKV